MRTFAEEFETGFNTSKWNDHIWYESSDPVINYKVGNGSLKIWPAAGFVNWTIDTDGKFSPLGKPGVTTGAAASRSGRAGARGAT